MYKKNDYCVPPPITKIDYTAQAIAESEYWNWREFLEYQEAIVRILEEGEK